MRKPDESLDNYVVKPAQEVKSKPPQAVSLRLTGEVEILDPLIRKEVPATTAYTSRSNARYQPLWFRRLIAAGSGALAIIALVLVSAILVGINDPASEPEVAISVWSDKQTEEPISFDVFSPSSRASVTGAIDVVRPHVRRKPVRPRIHLAAYKPKRQLRPLLRPEEPKFLPTTLVIYAQNGVINTRVEPWLQASDNKPPTLIY